MKHLYAIGALAALGILLSPAAASAKCNGNSNPVLVHNEGFESPGSGTSIPSWTVFNKGDTELLVADEAAKGGTQSLIMATVSGENRISQPIATTANSVYVVCFWLAPGSAAGTDSFRAQWDNQDMIVLKNIGSPTGANQNTFVYYQFFVVATGNDVLSFEERNDPHVFYLDNVDVQLVCNTCDIGNGVATKTKKPVFTPFKP